MTLNSRYAFGDIVFLKHDIQQAPWMVVSVYFHMGSVKPTYKLVSGCSEYGAYEDELSLDRDDVMKIRYDSIDV